MSFLNKSAKNAEVLEAQLKKVRGFLEKGDLQKEIDLNGARKNYEAAIENCDRILKSNKKNLAALNYKGFAFSKLGYTYLKLATSENTYADFTNELKGFRHMHENRLFEDALKCFKRALEIHPEDIDTLKGLGLVLTSKNSEDLYNFSNRWAEALKCFDKVLNIYPVDEVALMGKANAYQMHRDYKNALSTYEQLLKLKPKNRIEILFKVAFILDWLEHKEDAIKRYNEILELDPDNLDALKSKAKLLADFFGLNEEKKGDNEKAKEWYKKALPTCEKIFKMDPDDMDNVITLRKIYFVLGNTKKGSELTAILNRCLIKEVGKNRAADILRGKLR